MMAAEPRTQPSSSTLNVARCRTSAAHELREDIKGPDHLAEQFLSGPERLSLTNPAVFPLILKKLSDVSRGGYEYFIARTAYFDAVVKQALHDHVPQIVFLGAGYDTSGYTLIEHLNARQLEACYLTLQDQTLAGNVLDLFRIVQARVAD
jgi:O-methyltransferase involved in polyketide biosynthesis